MGVGDLCSEVDKALLSVISKELVSKYQNTSSKFANKLV